VFDTRLRAVRKREMGWDGWPGGGSYH